jgi:hypothetical protein
MSALGHKRTISKVRSMSALPPKADIGTQSRYLCELARKRAETITKEAIVQMSARLKPNCPPTMMR